MSNYYIVDYGNWELIKVGEDKMVIEKSEKEALILKFLDKYSKHHPTVMEMTNKELALAIVREIWGDMNLGDREEALLFEAIGRIYPGEL